MNKYLLFSVLVLISIFNSHATHLRGGSITFDCLESGTNKGKLIFSVKLLRACSSGNVSAPTSVTIQNPLYSQYGGASTITCSKVYAIDLAPACDTGLYYSSCGQPNNPTGRMIIEENFYQSAPTAIYGIPQTTGSHFTYSLCCRPNTSNSNNGSYYLRAVMYPYTDPATNQVLSLGSSTTGETCYDNSPVFVEPFKYRLHPGKMNYYTVKSFDADCDSLNYQQTVPMTNSTSSVTWKTGFSTTSPVPGIYHSTLNIPMIFNQYTGDASFLSMSASGLYNIAHKAVSYRNGQKIAEVFQDYTMQAVPNVPSDTMSIGNYSPSLSFKPKGSSSYHSASGLSLTYFVGDSVNIGIRAIDNGMITPSLAQSVEVRMIADPAIDGSFHNFYCTSSSCAYLDTTSSAWTGSIFKKQGQVDVDFKWHLTCDAMNPCVSYVEGISPDTVIYRFSVLATDNICPLPLQNIASFIIKVVDTTKREAQIKSVEVSGSSAEIKWARHLGTGFTTYSVYESDSILGPYSLLATISNRNDTDYLDNNALIYGMKKFYKVISDGSDHCASEINRASSVYLTVDDTTDYCSRLYWNGLQHDGRYISTTVYHLVDADTGSGWFKIDSIVANSDTLYVKDSLNTCQSSVNYRVRSFAPLEDYTTVSNIDSARYDFPIYNDSISICQGDSVMIGGKFRSASGSYMDSLSTFQGCDSLVMVELSVDSILNSYFNPEICKGDSMLINGQYRKQSGTYIESYTSNFGCDSLVNFNLTVKEIDTDVTTNGRSLTSKATNSLYQWIECTTFAGSPADTGKTFTPSVNGSYAVVIYQNGCVDTSACFDINTVGISNQMKGDVFVYPNPSDDYITFSNLNKYENGRLSILDATGKMIESIDHIESEEYRFSTARLKEGMYYFIFSSSNRSVQGKFVVRH